MDPLNAPAAPENKLHFLDYWRIIRIRKTVILAVFLLVLITATLVTFVLPEYYLSTASIKIDRDVTDITSFTGTRNPGVYDPYFIQTEFEAIKSEAILTNVIARFDLNNKWGRKYNNGKPLKQTDTLMILRKNMNLSPVRNTMFIDIGVYSDNAQEAADLANAIAEAYRDYRLLQIRNASEGGIKALEARFQEQQDKITKASQELAELRQKYEISDADAAGTGPAPSLDFTTVQHLNGLLTEGESQYQGEETKLRILKSFSRGELRKAIPNVVPDTQFTELSSQLNLAQQALIKVSKDYGTNSATYQNAEKLVSELTQKLDDRIDGILVGQEATVETMKAKVESLRKMLTDAKNADIKRASETRPYWDKKRELEVLLNFQKILETRLSAEKVDVSLPRSGMVEIMNRAVVQARPDRPNKPLNIALGVVVGLVVGIGLAFFIEYLDTSVKTIDDVERALQAPVLGVIPQNVGLLIKEGAESPHAEAYRVLRTNILFSRKDEKRNCMCVVSAGAGEGKSTTVFNLATIFAQSGHRVIIVDSDLRRPTLHKMVGVSNSIGLTNYLLKQNTLEQVIQTTSIPSFDFMASGKLPSSSLGILSSSQMKELIHELKQRYDFVFFDSPPIMGVSDASILASEVDMTMQVIQYRRYPQPMNIRAKQMIEKVGGNLVGIVLNNINMSQDESYYYYSGYYHDYYYSKNEDEDEKGAAKKPAGEKGGVEIKQKY
ncbi:MAG TPA: polysaccharide biosynthesis tyrosine autokinase [Verrucomicrobiae bacterium]|nr:polysaccharide biosynthesis tyrosine autokinase [Verrucomicrobiae bacterium]